MRVIKLKIVWKALILTMLALLLVSCTIQSVEQFEKMSDAEKSIEQLDVTNEEAEEQNTDDIAAMMQEVTAEKQIENTDEQQESDELVTSEVVDLHKDQQSGNDKAPKNKPSLDSSNQQDSENIKPTEKPTVPKTTKEPAIVTTPTSKPVEQEGIPSQKRYVTIAIYANTLLEHWDLLEPALQSNKYVPDDGVILQAGKYELLSDEETVWDVLLRATKEHKIQLEYQGASSNIYNSVYVEGINHLYEFSAGELSGWMYQVNGEYPNYGCGKYILADGDVIEWHYTVDLGRDLKAEM